MSKPSLTLFVAVAAGLGAVVYLEAQKVSDLETLSASMHAGNGELTAQADRNREEIRRLHEQIQVFKTESDELRKKLAAGKSGSDATPGGNANPAASDKPESGQSWMKGLAKMFTDPEMKKAMRVQQQVGIRMMYADLAKELGLSAEETQQLMEILADRQMDLSGAAMKNMDPKAANAEEQQKKMAETQKSYADQLKSVLGDERYKKLESYEGTMGDRWMMQQFEGQFAASGSPLEAPQKEKLLALMKQERANSPADKTNLMNNSNPAQQMKALSSEEGVSQFVTSQEDFNRRVLNRSRDILNADQVAAFEKVQAQQLDFMKMQMKMSREMFGLGK
jgi:hypothetical protein